MVAPFEHAPWQWWAGISDEYLTVGPCPTREAVIAAAMDERLGEIEVDGNWFCYFNICEARQDPLRLADYIDVESMVERADEAVSESDRIIYEHDEGPFFDPPQAQLIDLEAKIKAACDAWQVEHGLRYVPNTFSDVRSEEAMRIMVKPLDNPSPSE